MNSEIQAQKQVYADLEEVITLDKHDAIERFQSLAGENPLT